MRCVAEQIHDHGALGDSLVNIKEIGSWYPAINFSFFPRRAILPHANDDIQAIVTKVEALPVSLRPVTDERECVVLEVLLQTQ